MYILRCSNKTFYTGSTVNLEVRVIQHQSGKGANYTRKHRPVELAYFEEYPRIDYAFNREQQVKGWSHKKKQALIDGAVELLPKLSACQNHSHSKNKKS